MDQIRPVHFDSQSEWVEQARFLAILVRMTSSGNSKLRRGADENHVPVLANIVGRVTREGDELGILDGVAREGDEWSVREWAGFE